MTSTCWWWATAILISYFRGGQVRPVFGQAERMVDRADLVIGGTSSIAACGAARLGLHDGVRGVVGDDDFGHFIRERCPPTESI